MFTYRGFTVHWDKCPGWPGGGVWTVTDSAKRVCARLSGTQREVEQEIDRIIRADAQEVAI